MFKSPILCLLLTGFTHVNIAGDRPHSPQPTKPAPTTLDGPEDLKKPFLNIANVSLVRTAILLQMLSMVTDKDLLPWDKDEQTYRRNREITMTWAQMLRQLHTAPAAFHYWLDGVKDTEKKLTEDFSNLPNAITTTCDYIEGRFLRDVILNDEYRAVKDKVRADLKTMTFPRNVLYQQFEEGIDNSESWLALSNTRQVKPLYVQLMTADVLVFPAIIDMSTIEDLQFLSTIRTAYASAGNMAVRGQLEDIYDRVTSKISEDLKFLPNDTYSYKNNTLTVEELQRMLVSDFAKEMKENVNEISILKRAVDEANIQRLPTPISEPLPVPILGPEWFV